MPRRRDGGCGVSDGPVDAEERGTGEAVAAATDRRLQRLWRRRLVVFIVFAVVVFVADQIVKVAIRGSLEVGEKVEILPFFAISHTENDGIAFGLFPGRPGLVAALTAVALVAIGAAILSMLRSDPLVAIGGGALMGGSISNLIDRAVHGEVTDYLDPARWPALNIADIGIVCGAAAIVFALLRADEQRGTD